MADIVESPPESPDSVRVVKKGETPIDLTLSRSRHGVTLRVRVHPMVEDFIRAMGDGNQEDIRVHGRHWVPIGSEKALVYNLPKVALPPVLFAHDGSPYAFDRVARPLLITEGDEGGRSLSGLSRPITNLSMLRLCGASEGIGVTIGIKGVFSEEELKSTRQLLGTAARAFYLVYLKPINYGVRLDSYEY